MTAEAHPTPAPAARAVAPRAIAPAVAAPAAEIERVYVWDLVVRVSHWTIALSILLLSITGIYIGDPFVIASGPAVDLFVMGTMKVIHFYAAIAFTLAVLSRILWMFAGPPQASWRAFIPVDAGRRRDFVETIKFYLFVSLRPPPEDGHNPVAGAAYTAVFVLYLVMIATGLGLYSISADVESYMRAFSVLLPVFGGAQAARWIHHVAMWLLIGFTVHHVYSGMLMALVEKNGTIESIVSGYKFVTRNKVK